MDDETVGCERSWISVEDGHGETVQLPLLTVHGAGDGPTIVVLGGVHGDEYEGMAAVRVVFARLDPSVLRGTFLGVPVCNPPAFAAATRESPIDGLNLARIFPGRQDGSISERIADALTTNVLVHADFLIDLHSSGSRMSMPLLIGYAASDGPAARQSREAALRFGVPVVWGHERVAAGRSLSGPHAAGVPWLYTECPSGGWLHQEIAATYANGVLNVMRFLGMIPGDAPVAAIDHEFVGEGDVDQSLAVPVSGFLTPRVKLLDRVAAGDVLGTVEDAQGEVIAEMRAPVDGVVILRRESPASTAGDIAFLLT
ncbi:MAG TPA: succinylglutamate desuccinylase/aspartoacylase family protein [Thermomicrobiales bacterium]|nr:succinylglutamate desuccinylase/aspartoacylase family protein [Thermomicrobiales bacterium]